MLARITSAELTEWIAYFQAEAQDAQAAAEANKTKGRGVR